MTSNINGIGDGAAAIADLATRARRDPASDAGSGARGPGGLPGNGDAVAITDATSKIRAAEASLAAVPEVDTQRVEQVRQAIADGTYRADPDRIAHKLMDIEAALARGTGVGDDA